MRAALLGRDFEPIRKLFERYHIEEVASSPDVVVTYGGDGTLVGAEQHFPGIPKIPIRCGDKNNRQCPKHTPEQVLDRLVKGTIKEDKFLKVQMKLLNREQPPKTAMNEVGLHMANPASAVRFRLYVNDRPYVSEEIVGDGLIVCTSFGSTAYFRSVTRGTFRQGLGLAIENSVEPIEWAVLRETDHIKVEIIRGPALALADNDPEQWRLDAGDVVEFCAYDKPAVILGFDALTCLDCEVWPARPPR